MQCCVYMKELINQTTRFHIAPELIGTYCEADDKWYGKYKGIIVGPHRSYGDPRISVKIVECLRPPSTLPECFRGDKSNKIHVHREQYKPGEIHHFSIKDIIPLMEE